MMVKTEESLPICLGITGASGAIYTVRLLEVLLASGHDVHLSISPSGREVLKQELDLSVDIDDFQIANLLLGNAPDPSDSQIDLLRHRTDVSSGDSNVLEEGGGRTGTVRYCHYQDFLAPIASGSFRTGGMVICPCSGTTLSAVADGAAGNLIQRAAEVHLKERRRLILVPRETPLSLAHIRNMQRAYEIGATILPASPGWYHGVSHLRDLVDFVVARICDQLGIDNELMKRWGS